MFIHSILHIQKNKQKQTWPFQLPHLPNILSVPSACAKRHRSHGSQGVLTTADSKVARGLLVLLQCKFCHETSGKFWQIRWKTRKGCKLQQKCGFWCFTKYLHTHIYIYIYINIVYMLKVALWNHSSVTWPFLCRKWQLKWVSHDVAIICAIVESSSCIISFTQPMTAKMSIPSLIPLVLILFSLRITGPLL